MIPVLEIPEFKPDVPAWLLDGLSKDQIFMVESMSVLRQDSRWLKERMVDVYEEQASLQTRVTELQEFKDQLLHKPLLYTFALIGIVISASVGAFITKWIG